jgi:hydrogenase expression/formation protein HypC
MCIGAPRKLASVEGHLARSLEGLEVDVSLVAGEVAAGDWVLVHAGTAVRRLDECEALAVRDALAAADAAARGLPFEHLLADLIEREPVLPPHLAHGGDRK